MVRRHRTKYPKSFNAILPRTSKEKLIRFYHSTCSSPPVPEWLQVTQNNSFSTRPGLVEKTVRKYIIAVKATMQGHIKRIRKNRMPSKCVT